MMEQRRLGVSFRGQGLIGGVTVYKSSSSDLELMLEMWWLSLEEMVENGWAAAVMRRREWIFR